MVNVFKRAALAFGRFTALYSKPATQEFSLIPPLVEEAAASVTPELADAGASVTADIDASIEANLDLAAIELPAIEGIETPWTEADADAAVSGLDVFDAAPVQTVTEDVLPEVVAKDLDFISEPVSGPSAAPLNETFSAPTIELKPEASRFPTPSSTVTFNELYDLISGEANKRTESAVAVYERLLNATNHELDATRRNNRIAWSVGGVMTAVAAFGAVWASGEVAATRVEVGSLKQQVVAGQQASFERDQLRSDMVKVREATAKVEMDALKSRLDQALAVSMERDRQLEVTRRAKLEAESELRIARSAATQPVSIAQPAAAKVLADKAPSDKATGTERPDVWSVLLNGNDR